MLHTAIITPESAVYEGDALSVSLPTALGEITVLPHHIPLITMVVPGTITVRNQSNEWLFAVTRGVAEIDGSTVRILTDSADRSDDLQETAITEATKRAEELQRLRREDTEGFAEATAMLEREFAKLQTLRRTKWRRSSPRTP